MKILILSWRDIKHPSAGGAEILTFELSKRWTRKGHQVTWASAKTRQQKKQECIEGIKFIRQGSFYSVHLWAFYFYCKRWRGKFDIIIDQIHGLPFFTPIYVREKVVALICEVAEQIWSLEWPSPISLIGRSVENLYFKLYQNITFLTISKSTKNDLVKRGIKKIKVVYPGISHPTFVKTYPRKQNPTFIYLGRLAPMKRVEDLILAFSSVTKQFPAARLWIVGKGKLAYEKKLESLVKNLGLTPKIIFKGYQPEGEKWKLLQQSWALLSTSVKEGWGLVILEANSVGTPAITYNVPGLQESVIHRKTGLLTTNNNPTELSNLLRGYISHKNLRKELSKNAKVWSLNFSWDKAADETLQFLEAQLKTQ